MLKTDAIFSDFKVVRPLKIHNKTPFLGANFLPGIQTHSPREHNFAQQLCSLLQESHQQGEGARNKTLILSVASAKGGGVDPPDKFFSQNKKCLKCSETK